MNRALLITFALVPLAGLSAAAAEPVLLKESFQVLQRDAADLATCAVTLPETLPKNGRLIRAD